LSFALWPTLPIFHMSSSTLTIIYSLAIHNKHTCVYITNIQLHAILMSTYIYINTIINNRIDQKRLALILY
jgi:hypothetical protein